MRQSGRFSLSKPVAKMNIVYGKAFDRNGIIYPLEALTRAEAEALHAKFYALPPRISNLAKSYSPFPPPPADLGLDS